MQAEHVGDAPGGDRAGDAGEHVSAQLLGFPHHAVVVVVADPGEDAGVGAGQRARVDASAFECLPGGLQQQALLRVHAEGLDRGEAEEVRVELGHVGQEAAEPGRFAVERPAAPVRDPGDRVDVVRHQPPQVLRRGDPAGEAAGHADHGDGLLGRHRRRCAHPPGGAALDQPGEVFGERTGRGVVEDQRRRQAQPGQSGQPVAEFDRGQRVHAEVPERGVAGHRPLRTVAEHRRQRCADQVADGLGAPVAGLGPAPGAEDLAEHRRDRGGRVGRPEHRRHDGGVRAHRGVEQAQRGLDVQTGQSGRGQPAPVGLAELAHHADLGRPRPPRQGHRGQPPVPAVRGQRVEVGVGGRVVGLAHAAEDTGDRGEQHQVRGPGEFVQVRGPVDLGAQDPGQLLGGQRLDEGVVDDPGEVDHGAEGAAGHGGGQRGAVGDVRRHHRDLGVQIVELGRVTPGPAQQQQFAHAVLADEVAGQCPAETTGAAGDQHGALGFPAAWRGFCRHQPGHQRPSVTHPQFRLARREQGWRPGVAVDQDEPARVLGLRRAHQAAGGGPGEVLADDHGQRRHRPGQPLLDHPQHRPRGRVRIRLVEHEHVPDGVGRVDRVPPQLVQPAGGHRWPEDHAVDGEDHRTGGVGDRDGDRSRRGPGEQGPRGRRTGQVEPGPRPRERHPVGGNTDQRGGLEGDVHRGRVRAVAGGVGRGRLDLDVGGRAARPGPAQAPALRPVPGPVRCQLRVEVADVQFRRGCGRPVEHRAGGAVGAEDRGGVQHPRQAGRPPGVHGGAGAGHDHARLGGQHQRRVQDQFLDAVHPGLRGGLEHEFGDARAGEHDLLAHPVLAQPRLRVGREPSGQHHAVHPRQLHDVADQRVPGSGPARAGVEPEPAVLEGVGGQGDPPGTGEHRRPVDRAAVRGEHPEGEVHLREVPAAAVSYTCIRDRVCSMAPVSTGCGPTSRKRS